MIIIIIIHNNKGPGEAECLVLLHLGALLGYDGLQAILLATMQLLTL